MQLQSLYPCLWRYMGYAQIAEHTTGIIKEPAKYGNKVRGNLMGFVTFCFKTDPSYLYWQCEQSLMYIL